MAASASGLFGYSHMMGGYAGGQAEYVRVPFADVGPLKVPPQLSDEQVLFLSDIFPTGYMAAENCNIQPGDTVAVWGCGPGRPVRDQERVDARRGPGGRDRSSAGTAAHGRRSGQGRDDQLRTPGRVRGAEDDDRRTRSRCVHRRRRPGGSRHQLRLLLRQGEDRGVPRDRSRLRAAPGHHTAAAKAARSPSRAFTADSSTRCRSVPPFTRV